MSDDPVSQGVVSRNQVVVEFEDQYGERRVIHKKKGRLAVKRLGDTPVHALNRAAAVLIGRNIRAFRIHRGWTMAELCVKAGLVSASPKQRIRELEVGERSEGMRLGTLYALAMALEVDVAVLLPTPGEVAAMADVAPATVTALQVGTAA